MPKQKRPFAPVRDGILEHHAKMTWAEIAVFHHLLSRANRTETVRSGPIGLCSGLTGNKVAMEMNKSRGATHKALSGLEGTKGPRGIQRRPYIKQSRAGIVVLNFDPDLESAAGQIPAGQIPAGQIPAGQIPAGQIPAGTGQIPATSRPDSSRNRPDSGHPSLLRDVDVSEDVDDLSGVADDSGLSELTELGPVHWEGALERLVVDEDWLHDEIDDYQRKAGVQLTRMEYLEMVEDLRMELVRDPRMRACIKLASGKPSSKSQFKRLATYTAGRFLKAIQQKAKRASRSAAPRVEPIYERPDPEKTARSIRACTRDHAKEKVQGSEVWFCPDSCGWTERLPEGQRRKSTP